MIFVIKKFKLTCMGVHSNYNELQPVRNEDYHAVCATSVRIVFCIFFGGGVISKVGGLNPQPPCPRPCPALMRVNHGASFISADSQGLEKMPCRCQYMLTAVK